MAPRKNSPKSTVTQSGADTTAVTETVTETPTNTAVNVEQQPAALSGGDSNDDAAVRTRKRAGPLDRLATAIETLKGLQQPGATTNARAAAISLNRAIATLEKVQGDLGSAKILPIKKPRTPNEYNQFVSTQMHTLKDADMTSTEKFRHCIQLWNEHKASVAAANAAPITPPTPIAVC